MTVLPCRSLSPALFLAAAGTFCLCSFPQPATAAQPAGQAQPATADSTDSSSGELVYFGTYSRGKSEGIYVSRFNPETGHLGQPQLAAKTQHPSFLALHPNGRLLYAVNEISRKEDQSGLVTAFAIDRKTGLLQELNSAPSAGAHPCHLVVDSAGRNLLVANYTGGNVAVLPLEENGRLNGNVHPVQHHGSSINPKRQQEPHAHSINLDASGRYAVAADLGIDQLLVYRFNPRQGKLESAGSARVKAGGGPRHFTFHPNGQFAWVINELDSTITAFSWDADSGRLKNLQTVSTLPAEFDGRNSTAEIRVHPSGDFLYGSNRGHHSLAIFRINQQTGQLTAAGHHSSGGSTPRNFNIHPNGRFLLAANQETGNVVVLRVDQQTGALSPTGQEVKVDFPVCVRFLSEVAN